MNETPNEARTLIVAIADNLYQYNFANNNEGQNMNSAKTTFIDLREQLSELTMMLRKYDMIFLKRNKTVESIN